MNRYVILRHQLPAGQPRPSHWDLMLEHAGVLLTWALSRPIDEAPQQPVERLADHRLEYLDYEGAVSGDRGQVTRWDRGACEIVELASDRVVANLAGAHLQGRLSLVQSSPDSATWTLHFAPRAAQD